MTGEEPRDVGAQELGASVQSSICMTRPTAVRALRVPLPVVELRLEAEEKIDCMRPVTVTPGVRQLARTSNGPSSWAK